MKVYSVQTDRAKKIISGLKRNLDLVKNKELDDDFIAELEAETDAVVSYNEEIDKLKAEAKSKNIQASCKLQRVKLKIKQAKRIVKQNFDQSQWKNFGINDKR